MPCFVESDKLCTYEELAKSLEVRNKAIEEYKTNFFNYLAYCRNKAGFTDVLLRNKHNGKIGKLAIVGTGTHTMYPYEFRFYPLKKNGEVSLNSCYVDFKPWRVAEMYDTLIKRFEVVGDSVES